MWRRGRATFRVAFHLAPGRCDCPTWSYDMWLVRGDPGRSSETIITPLASPTR